MATHSSILTWEIPWTEEYGALPSTGSQKKWTWLYNYTPTLSLFLSLWVCVCVREREREKIYVGVHISHFSDDILWSKELLNFIKFCVFIWLLFISIYHFCFGVIFQKPFLNHDNKDIRVGQEVCSCFPLRFMEKCTGDFLANLMYFYISMWNFISLSLALYL